MFAGYLYVIIYHMNICHCSISRVKPRVGEIPQTAATPSTSHTMDDNVSAIEVKPKRISDGRINDTSISLLPTNQTKIVCSIVLSKSHQV